VPFTLSNLYLNWLILYDETPKTVESLSCPIEGPERSAGKPSFYFVFGSRSQRFIDLKIYRSVDLSQSV
jgi:hypothetical protein